MTFLVFIEQHPLTARAALIWNGDLPRQLQQVLFDTADSIGLWLRPIAAGSSRVA
jgi:hypothetical protein